VSPSDFYQFSVGQLTGNIWSLDLKLAALETAEELKIVAAPKVLTLNNVKAKVSQGTQIPYLVASTATPAAGAVSSTEFKDATIELQVVPHITPDHKVRLEIDAKQDEPGVVINSQTSIDTRKIQTELLVDDGNIVVIGGVIRDRSDFSRSATPGLHRVPVLGWLFKSEDNVSEKTELLIFISPKIIEPSGPPDYK
jgi:type IV pilus assembly protein PilQ